MCALDCQCESFITEVSQSSSCGSAYIVAYGERERERGNVMTCNNHGVSIASKTELAVSFARVYSACVGEILRCYRRQKR